MDDYSSTKLQPWHDKMEEIESLIIVDTTNIGNDAFNYCPNLEKIYFAGETGPTTCGSDIFRKTAVSAVSVTEKYTGEDFCGMNVVKEEKDDDDNNDNDEKEEEKEYSTHSVKSSSSSSGRSTSGQSSSSYEESEN